MTGAVIKISPFNFRIVKPEATARFVRVFMTDMVSQFDVQCDSVCELKSVGTCFVAVLDDIKLC